MMKNLKEYKIGKIDIATLLRMKISLCSFQNVIYSQKIAFNNSLYRYAANFFRLRCCRDKKEWLREI